MEENLVGGSKGADEAEAIVPEPVTVITRGNGGGPRELVAYHAIHDDLEQLQSLPPLRRVDVDRDNEALRSNGVELRPRVRGTLDTVENSSRRRGAEHVVVTNVTRRDKVVETEPRGLLALRSSNDAWIARALRAEIVSLYWTGKCEHDCGSSPRQRQHRCCCREAYPRQSPFAPHDSLPCSEKKLKLPHRLLHLGYSIWGGTHPSPSIVNFWTTVVAKHFRP